jgi:predicted GNAT superfamily acetyltransferase
VCFRENSEYQSKNYQFFQKRFKKFFYIDRIGVVKTFKNKGLGTFVYREIDKICEKDSLPICAEVNIVPMNKESVNFHEKMGFNMISDAYASPNYAVRYFEKCM